MTTPAGDYRVTEMTCARDECLAEPERDHTGGYRPLCGTCRHWPDNHPEAVRPVDHILDANEKRAKRMDGPPTVASLDKDIKDTLRVRARWTPAVHAELTRRFEIPNERDGHSAGSRLRERVTGGGTSTPTEEAASARIDRRGDHDDPQAEALRVIASSLQLLEVAALQIEGSTWIPHLELLVGLPAGHWLRTESDPQMVELLMGTAPLPRAKANKRLKWLWDLGDKGSGKSFREFVEGVRASGKLARQIEFRIIAIEKATGRKV